MKKKVRAIEEKVYSREEVESILHRYFMSNVIEQTISTEDWIKENL